MKSTRLLFASLSLIAVFSTLPPASAGLLHRQAQQANSSSKRVVPVKFLYTHSWEGRVGGRAKSGRVTIEGRFNASKLTIEYDCNDRFGTKEEDWSWKGKLDEDLYRKCLEIIRKTRFSQPPKQDPKPTSIEGSNQKPGSGGYMQSWATIKFTYANGAEQAGYPSNLADWFNLAEEFKSKAGPPTKTDRRRPPP